MREDMIVRVPPRTERMKVQTPVGEFWYTNMGDHVLVWAIDYGQTKTWQIGREPPVPTFTTKEEADAWLAR